MVGLCRGDRSAAVDENGPKLDRIRKDIVLFREEGLSITIKTNLIETDFLNIVLSIL